MQQLNTALAGAGGTTDQIARDAAAAAQTTADTATASVAALTPRVSTLETTVAGQGAAIVGAQSTADTARSEAATAQTTANTARTEAAAARTVADDAWTLADNGMRLSTSLSVRVDTIEATTASTYTLATEARTIATRGHHRKRNKSYAKLMPSNLVALITFRQAAVCAMPMRSLNMGCRLAARCKRLRQAVKNAAVSSLPRLATPLTQVF